jgi:CDP-2,3-bis-(O-geranylgeranyl)-sn-glycerol synthase
VGVIDLAERVAQLAYAMAPAYAANMTPPLVVFWHGWNRPISTRWLGAHKTVIGFVAGVLMAIAVVYVQHVLAWPGALVRTDHWLVVGTLFGVGAMGGDTAKSALKRRIGIPPGHRWIPADQLDFVLGALVLVWPFATLTALDVCGILALTLVGHIAVDHLAYWLGIRTTAW